MMHSSSRSRRGFRTAVSSSDGSEQKDAERTVQAIARKMLVYVKLNKRKFGTNISHC